MSRTWTRIQNAKIIRGYNINNTFTKCLFLASFVAFYTLVLIWVKAPRKLAEPEFFQLLNQKYFHGNYTPRVIGKKCKGSECLIATDRLIFDQKGKHSVLRCLTLREPSIARGVITATLLETPATYDTTLDTAVWNVDRTFIDVISQQHALIENMFMSGALQMSTDAAGRILTIGIGGAGIPNYFSALYPNVDVTAVDIDQTALDVSQSWFGFRPSPRSRAIIENGVATLRRLAQRGERLDAILVDACFNSVDLASQSDGWACPVSAFHADDVINDMSSIVGDTGVVSINVLYYGKGYEAKTFTVKLEQLRRKFAAHFKSCKLYTRNGFFPNYTLTCFNISSKKTGRTRNDVRKFLRANGARHSLDDLNHTILKFPERTTL